MNTFLDISGYGNAGKGVINDMLKEYEGFNVPDQLFEFNLLRIQGGLLDLCNNVHENWSPIRSDAAVERFRKLILSMGTTSSIWNFSSLWTSRGFNYNYYFDNRFIEISNTYVNKLVLFESRKDWPYKTVEHNGLRVFIERFLRIITGKKYPKRNFSMVTNENFLEHTRNYLEELFSVINQKNAHTFVLNNATEPFFPSKSLDLFHSGKSIIVSRDPRDIFAELYVSNSNSNFIPPHLKDKRLWDQKESFLLTKNIDKFILQQKIFLNAHKKNNDDNRVLRVRFEDIVLNYEIEMKNILNFINPPIINHVSPKKYFNPELSKKNIGLWKQMKNSENIKRIELELSEYCYKE
ncbi:sulfotransferase [Flavobacteriaceae bacterium]|nr:sulfotransferase [Flavobacteriaceae bacterium]